MTLPSFFLNKLIDFGVELFSSCRDRRSACDQHYGSYVCTYVCGQYHTHSRNTEQMPTYVCVCALIGRLIHQGHHPLLHAHNPHPTPHKQALTHTYTRDRGRHTSTTFPVLLWFSSWLSLDATEIRVGGLVLLLGLGPSSWGTERQSNTTSTQVHTYVAYPTCTPAHRYCTSRCLPSLLHPLPPPCQSHAYRLLLTH